MAVDGHVDIRAVLDKGRAKGVDGEGQVEAKAEFEASLGEVFGIDMVRNITGSIFGTVASDGSFSMVRFSTNGPKQAVNMAGWGFSDGTRTIRFGMSGGSIKVFELQSDGTWTEIINIETVVPVSMLELQDTLFSAYTADKCLVVAGGGDTGGGEFNYGEDTVTNGITEFFRLEDVFQHSVLQGWPVGTLVSTNGTDEIEPLSAEGITPLISSFSLKNEVIKPGVFQYLDRLWTQDSQPSEYDEVENSVVDDKGRFSLPIPGVYRINLSWKMIQGTHSVLPYGPGTSRVLPAIVGYSVHKFPAGKNFSCEPWWYSPDVAYTAADLESQEGQTRINGARGLMTVFMISAGGSAAYVRAAFEHRIRGDAPTMNFYLSFERVG